MKKFYYSVFAAATMLLVTTSCSQDEELVQQGTNDVTTFKVELQGAVGSRAAGDGQTVDRLYYEVYQGETKVLDNLGDDSNATEVVIEDGLATVEMPLLRGENYDIIFWAQTATGSIYDATDLKAIGVDYSKANANVEAYDAFFNALDDFKATSGATEVELRRPFAQLNIGTIDTDWQNAKTMIGGTGAPVTASKVEVTGLATTFNALTGEAKTESDVIFKQNALLVVTTIDGEDNETQEVETFEVITKDADGKDNTNTYYNLAMNYLLVPGTKSPQGLDEHIAATETEVIKTNTDVKATFWRGSNELFTLDIPNVTIQRNYRTNIYGTLLSAEKTFKIEVVPDFDGDHNYSHTTVDNDEDLEKLLREDKEHIVVDLAGESRAAKTYSINISANTEKYYFGTADTKTITINANGNTINFIHNNTDWNYIRCVSDDTKWIINDAHLTNSGKDGGENYNNGPWNRHNIRFYNAVELNNVTSDKAIALLNDGKLTKVEISDARQTDDFGLWITAEGQTVELDGCTFNMIKEGSTTGRGIAIKDQYVDEADRKPVTLTVKNTSFNTEAKSAILVTSTVGANIKLENVDLSDVAADKFNAVWVDEERPESYDLVTVEGGFKVLEGKNESVFKNDATIELPTGSFTLPTLANYENITIIGDENGGTVIGGGNATTGFASNFGKNTTIKNVTFSGKTNGVRWSYAKGGDTTFDNCTFAGESTYGFHIDESNGANFTFNNCIFSGFNAFAGDLVSVTFNNCTFKNNGNYGHTNIHSTGNFNNCTWEDKTSVSPAKTTAKLFFDGEEQSYHHEFIGSAESLFDFAKSVNVGEGEPVKRDSWDGQAVILVNDIDLENADWEPIGQTGVCTFNGVFDGQGHTIKNLKVDSKAEEGANYSSGLFGWIEAHSTDDFHGVIKNVTVKGAEIDGHHNCAVIAGYLIGKIVGCHVEDATVNCTSVNDDANGDKAGSIAGILAEHNAYITNCTAKDVNISAGRDAGQIVGTALKGWDKNVTGCSAENVNVSWNETSTGANIKNELIGRTE